MRLSGRVVGPYLAIAALALVFGTWVRFQDLNVNPPGLWQDEASTAVDAYYIWHTGRDRAGVFLPVISKSFGDYPLALYRYLDAPIVGLFGLTPGHERLVAAISGAGLIAAAGGLALLCFGTLEALGVMLSIAVTPMAIVFSRYGSEAILLPLLLTLGAALVEVGRTRRWALWAGAFALAASAYTYHAVKLLLPLWVLGLVVYHWPLIRTLWRDERAHLVGPALVFSILVVPSFLAALTPEGMARGRTVMAWYHVAPRDLPLHILRNYLAYYDPRPLFFRGGPSPAQSIPGVGIFAYVDLPLIVLGLAAIVRARTRALGFLLFWFLVGPLPGALSNDMLNVGRSIGWLPAPQLVAGVGFGLIVRTIQARWGTAPTVFRALAAGVGVLVAGGFVATGASVARHTLVDIRRNTNDWQYDVNTTMECSLQRREHGERFVVSPRFPIPEIFAEFHYGHLYEPGTDPDRVWTVDERTAVEPGELFVFPSSVEAPDGKQVCAVEDPYSGEALGFVYRAPDRPRPEPEERGLLPRMVAPTEVPVEGVEAH